MKQYKLYITDRMYTDYDFLSNENKPFDELKKNFNPIENCLFNGDIIDYDNGVKNVYSPIRNSKYLSGILVLSDNKIYGKHKNKFLYKCIPDDKRIPVFLIPYEIKNTSFDKTVVNKYVLFRFNKWDIDDKHPSGILHESLGNVDIITNYYEYQLYCKSLYSSMSLFNKETRNRFKNKTNDDYIEKILQKHKNIEDRTHLNVFTIDPPKSQDYDDGMGIQIKSNQTILSIYISNVVMWMDVLDLWSAFSERVATIYLPDYKRPMLPTILSDSLCSLIKNERRFALSLDIIIENGVIVDFKFLNTIIKINENYEYEDSKLLENNDYKNIVKTIGLISNEKKYKYIHHINSSNDVVTYLMIMMNYISSRNMYENKNGIYRAVAINKSYEIPQDIPENIKKYLKIWHSSTGQYMLYDNNVQHDLLEMETYIHITSPIRRLVDLLNLMQLQWNLNIIKKTDESDIFYTKWIEKLDYINITMRSIRKVQTDCNLLNICTKSNKILENVYEGYIFDKLARNDGLFHYIVYLPELKLTNRIILIDNIEDYSKMNFKIYIFNDESTLKRKMRLQIV